MERRLFEYFIVAGLSDEAEELTPLAHECGNKSLEPVAPITDLTVIFPGLGETVCPSHAIDRCFLSGTRRLRVHRNHSVRLCGRLKPRVYKNSLGIPMLQTRLS